MSAFHIGGGGEHEIRLSCSYLDPGHIEDGVGRLADFLRGISAHALGSAVST
jgi:(S)-3,5-dihydroxyphenylglycine transaminase